MELTINRQKYIFYYTGLFAGYFTHRFDIKTSSMMFSLVSVWQDERRPLIGPHQSPEQQVPAIDIIKLEQSYLYTNTKEKINQ